MTTQEALEPFVHQKTVLLITYRRNGAPVATLPLKRHVAPPIFPN